MSSGVLVLPKEWIREVSPTDYSLFREPGIWRKLVNMLDLPDVAVKRERHYFQKILAERGNLFVLVDDNRRIHCVAFLSSYSELPAVKLQRFHVHDTPHQELLVGFLTAIVKRFSSDRFFVNKIAHHEQETVHWLRQTIRDLQKELQLKPAQLFEGYAKNIEAFDDPLAHMPQRTGFIRQFFDDILLSMTGPY